MTTPSPRTTAEASTNWRMIVLFLVTLGIVGLCALLAFPFVPAITGAVALTVATRAPYDWLERHLRHPTLTAALGVLLVILLIVGPVALLVQSLGQQAVGAAAQVQSGAAQDWLTETVDRIPWLNRLVDEALGVVNLRQAAQGTAGFIAGRLRGLLTGSVATVTQMVLMLFTLFFLFRDRREAARAFRSLLPLSESQRDQLIKRMSNTIEATLQGSLTIAAIQGALGGNHVLDFERTDCAGLGPGHGAVSHDSFIRHLPGMDARHDLSGGDGALGESPDFTALGHICHRDGRQSAVPYAGWQKNAVAHGAGAVCRARRHRVIRDKRDCARAAGVDDGGDAASDLESRHSAAGLETAHPMARNRFGQWMV